MIRILLGVFLLTPLAVWGANDEVIVRTIVGADTSPPSTPIITATEAMSSNQIDITWSAVTDNTIVLGYRVYRNGVFIATTTQTVYNDTGLSPATLYSYEIDAFDMFYNISSTSLPSATTTWALPIPPTPTSSPERVTESTSGPRLVGEVVVSPAELSANFHWQTNRPAKFYLRWGRTTNYELGVIASNVLSSKHKTDIYNLEPGTRYYYEITAETPYGFLSPLKTGQFTTLPPDSVSVTPNVLNFTATVEGKTVLLSWQNPPSPFRYVRVVRSHLDYPYYPEDGQVVYEGQGNSYTDTDSLTSFSPLYYTVFVYGPSGSVSSGAIASAAIASRLGQPGYLEIKDTDWPLSTSSLPNTEPTTPIDITPVGSDAWLSAEEVYFEQGLNTFTMAETIELSAELSTLVYVPVSAVPPHLKSIILTVFDVTDQRKQARFLLKLSPDEERYQALLPPTRRAGAARVSLEIFDYETGLVRRITAPLIFSAEPASVVWWPDLLVRYWPWLAIFLLLSVSFLVFSRRRSK